jgi:glycerol-3-phosphate dehydrogenase
LIHGGVRYLAQGNVPLVREALHERGLLMRNASHLVHPRDFVIPAYHYWQLPYYASGLWLYDRLAGQLRLNRSRWVSRSEVVSRVPTIHLEKLRGGIVYTDGQFDDARLAVSLARTLADLGGVALNHTTVTQLIKSAGKVSGARARDGETGEEFEFSARVVINAAGVFGDAVRQLDETTAAPTLTPSQRAHLVLNRSFLPGETAIMVPKTDDGRVLFAIPWHDRVIVGTTETPTEGVMCEPLPVKAEIEYLLDHAGRYLEKGPGVGDVMSMFAGLRPLINVSQSTSQRTSRLSREHAVFVSKSGLVTVTGGKWTTYRRMARDAVDSAAKVARLPDRPCVTERLQLRGATSEPMPADGHLDVYGTDRDAVLQLLKEQPRSAEPLHGSLPYLRGEVNWAVRHEAARTIEDVLARRTRALFLDARAAIEMAPVVADLVAKELGRDSLWQDDQVRRFHGLAAGYLPG